VIEQVLITEAHDEAYFWASHQSAKIELLLRKNGKIFGLEPEVRTSKGRRGVFATRSLVRPNPIAISELQVLAINDNQVEVRNLLHVIRRGGFIRSAGSNKYPL